jgi:cleavage and polyadenylation specificity factor subunit 1
MKELLNWLGIHHGLKWNRLTSLQLSFEPLMFKSLLRVDPNSRLAALTLPRDAVALLPFYQSQAELDLMDLDQSIARYAGYLLSLRTNDINNV